MVDGNKNVKAQSVAKACQGPDLKGGLVATSRCVDLRSPRLQVISLGALGERIVWCLEAKKAFLQVDNSDREVFLRVPMEWGPDTARRTWKLHAPAHALYGAPEAFHSTLKRYLLNSENASTLTSLKFQASWFGPCLYFVFRKGGGAAGAVAAHNDDILGCAEPDIRCKVRGFLERRLGNLEVLEKSCVLRDRFLGAVGPGRVYSGIASYSHFARFVGSSSTPVAV